MELAPNLHRLGTSSLINSYVIDDGGQLTIIDAGQAGIERSTTLDVPGAPVVLPMPGHTPGSVAHHVPAVDAIFMGDAMTTRSVLTGAVGPAPAPLTVDRAQAARSLDALAEVSATWVLPGHGDAWWTGLPEALRLINAGREAA